MSIQWKHSDDLRHGKADKTTLTSYVDDTSELAEESFVDLCSDDPIEKALTFTEEELFSIDSRADEYARLMDMNA